MSGLLSYQVLCECSLSLGNQLRANHKEVKKYMPFLMGYGSGRKLLIRLQNSVKQAHASPTVTIETLWIPDAVLCSTSSTNRGGDSC